MHTRCTCKHRQHINQAVPHSPLTKQYSTLRYVLGAVNCHLTPRRHFGVSGGLPRIILYWAPYLLKLQFHSRTPPYSGPRMGEVQQRERLQARSSTSKIEELTTLDTDGAHLCTGASQRSFTLVYSPWGMGDQRDPSQAPYIPRAGSLRPQHLRLVYFPSRPGPRGGILGCIRVGDREFTTWRFWSTPGGGVEAVAKVVNICWNRVFWGGKI